MNAIIAVSAFVLLFIWLIVRAKKPKPMQLEPDDASVTLDLLLEEAEKTNDLLRQLLRAYGHEPEA